MELVDLLATTADGVCVMDAEQRITSWSRAAQRILGYSPEEALGRRCYELLAGRDRAGALVCRASCAAVAAARAGQAWPSHDLHTTARDGRSVCLNVTHFFAAPGGELAALGLVFRDVTLEREKEALGVQLLTALRRLDSLDGQREAASGLPPAIAAKLTRREAEVLALLCTGASTRTIAERLSTSLSTVRKHNQGIFAKLGVHSSREAVALVSRTRAFGRSGYLWELPAEAVVL